MVFSHLMLIWVSNSVNNHLMLTVLQETSLKMGPNLYVLCFSMYDGERKSEKCVSSNVIHHCANPIEWHGCSASSLLSFFGNLSWHCREGDVTLAQFKNSLLLYGVQTVEKIDIFIRDRALKECPLCRSQYGCLLLHQLKHLSMM